MQFPSEARVKRVKSEFQKGTRVECVRLNDPWSPIHPGEKGTVDLVDDVGTIHIRWDSGRYLGAVLGEDKVMAIKEEEA